MKFKPGDTVRWINHTGVNGTTCEVIEAGDGLSICDRKGVNGVNCSCDGVDPHRGYLLRIIKPKEIKGTDTWLTNKTVHVSEDYDQYMEPCLIFKYKKAGCVVPNEPECLCDPIALASAGHIAGCAWMAARTTGGG